jgi:anhydro-N-acetylmuramic acid kinase
MSGTSLDGIDVAICDFYPINGRLRFELLAYDEVPYPSKIKNKIQDVINNKVTIKDISQLNFALAELYSNALIQLCEKKSVSLKSINSVGVHGQTVWHNPEEEYFCGMNVASTLQLGSISAMKEKLGINVIGDFRSADVALGGQGAPLVPIFDWEFIRSENENIACVNIGGISNITYLPQNCRIADILGFDCGPGNVLLDLSAKKYFDKSCDFNGDIAKTGNLIYELLEKLMGLPFIKCDIPKSTGRELFNEQFLSEMQIHNYPPEDQLRTLTEFTAAALYKHIIELPSHIDKIYISGGGSKNSFLMERIRSILPQRIKITDTSAIGINSDAKEAICFSYLAYLHNQNLPGNVPSVTGSDKRAILGIS